MKNISYFSGMKIAITGTRGIPNNYGGFEELAEQLSIRLAERGFDVVVYNPMSHPGKNRLYKGVRIEWIKEPIPRIAQLSALLYDYRCLMDARRKNVDVILNCGYTSSVFYPVLKKKNTPPIITHMDGMEWQRKKWGIPATRFLKWTEARAVKYSDRIVTDHPVVRQYYQDRYGVRAECIAYGGDQTVFSEADPISDLQIKTPDHSKGKPFFLILSRIEPENNIALIIQAYLKSGSENNLLIVGDTNTHYGRKITGQFRAQSGVVFLGRVFDRQVLQSLRKNCLAYFHGHSVGGTNPSLSQAMASGCLILAHDNLFNRELLQGNGLYFKSVDECASLIRNLDTHLKQKHRFGLNNLKCVEEKYNWRTITQLYIDLFNRVGQMV